MNATASRFRQMMRFVAIGTILVDLRGADMHQNALFPALY